MLEKHLKDIGRFVREQAEEAQDAAVSRAADEALTLTGAVEEKIDTLGKRLGADLDTIADEVALTGTTARSVATDLVNSAEKALTESIESVAELTTEQYGEVKENLANMAVRVSTGLVAVSDDADATALKYASEVEQKAAAKLEKAVESVRSDLALSSAEHNKALSELRDNLEQALNAANDELIERHLAELETLTEQIRAQEVFEAQLTQRIAEIKDGEKGQQGEQGEQGDCGVDGLDRPMLEPVELEDRDYTKNTLGTYANGLWIAQKDAQGDPSTDPHAWHCILDAMTTMAVDFADDHRFNLSVKMATGQVLEDTFEIPFPTHEGIWEEGKSYTKGQWVTKGSSVWKALEDTDGTPPGNGWQQIIKAPRGTKGEKGDTVVGPQGKPGRNGSDAVLPEGFVDEIRATASERKAFEDGRSDAYAITSYRGYFQPGERYNAGDTVDQMGSVYLCKSGGSWEKFADAAPNFELFVNVPQQAPLPPYALWRNVWASGNTYDVGNMVRDGAWLMCANTKTQDRPAPQAIGAEQNIYDGADPTAQQQAKTLTHGALYTVVTPVWVNGYRIYTVTGNNYRTYSVTNGGTISELLAFEADSTGWGEFTLAPTPLTVGETFALLSVVSEPDPTPTTFTGDWLYNTPNNPSVPVLGEIIHANNESSVLRISKVDDNGGDRAAELEALTVGDIIDSGNIRWAIQTISDNGNWMGFGIAPATQDAPDGVREFTFETVTATPVTYLSDSDYYAAEPAVQGLLGIDIPLEDIVPDQNAYGVDLIIQAASISPDWDMMAYSSDFSTGEVAATNDPSTLSVRHEVVLSSENYDDQTPTARGVALQIIFGAATVGAYWDIAADGTATCKTAGQYAVGVNLSVGRRNSAGVAQVYSRMMINGSQFDHSSHVIMDTDDFEIPSTHLISIDFEVGDEVTVEIIRDTDGANSGGIYAGSPDVPGWNPSPSAQIYFERTYIL